MNLYEIDIEYLAIMQELLDSEGDLSPELEERLNLNGDDYQKKIENYIYIISQFTANADMIKNEVTRLATRQKQLIKRADELKERIKDSLESRQKDKLELPLHTVKFRKSTVVEIKEDTILDEKYIRIKEEPNKELIKKALIEGVEIEGCALKQKQNLVIE